MQICKRFYGAVFAFAAISLSSVLSAESIEMPEMPSMPEISTDLDMPEITNPVMGGKFYNPTVPSIKNTGSNGDSKTSTAASSTGTVLTDATTSQDLINSYLNGTSALTASDISTLYDSGLFGSLSGLTGLSGLTTSGNNVLSDSSTASTNVMLQQILSSLEELKTEQKNATAAEKKSIEQQQLDNQTFKNREPSILRFKINGYNMNDSLTKVFFSEPEADGSFLLTADRKYFTNQKARTETFYILFKAVNDRGSTTTYTVQPSVVQDSKNENSYIYKFCHLKNLTAEKTGNLVVLRQDGETNVDLLLDIDH